MISEADGSRSDGFRMKVFPQGAPLELFEQPRTGFVAGFLGSPSINLVPATSRQAAAAPQLCFSPAVR
jgi:multiple sugar transport system ATP-binding protein